MAYPTKSYRWLVLSGDNLLEAFDTKINAINYAKKQALRDGGPLFVALTYTQIERSVDVVETPFP